MDNKNYQTILAFVIRRHDDRNLYKSFHQFGHEILDDETLERIFACIEQALLEERESNFISERL